MTNTVLIEFLAPDSALIRLGSAEERVVTLTSERMETLRSALAQCRGKESEIDYYSR